MKTTKIILILSLLVTVNLSFGQLKYTNSNMLGINRIPSYTLDVEGTTRLNGYVGINGPVPVGLPFAITSYYGQVITVNPGANTGTTAIGSSTDVINFWYSDATGHHRLYAHAYSTTSDSTLKKNIESLQSGALQKVLNLRPVAYNYKNEEQRSDGNKLKEIGLLAQEVEQVIPEAVSFSKLGNVKMLDYNMITPVLIKAIQEQEAIIESLQKEINKLKSSGTAAKNSSSEQGVTEELNSSLASLEQNTPNPFSQSTEIRYFLPETTIQAYLYVYNMNGLQVKHIKITQKGQGCITIAGSELQPGMYLYALIADGKEIDTKRMILTQ